MRKVLMLVAFVMSAGFVSAQECTKAQKAACAKTCTKTAAAAVSAEGSQVLSAEAQAELAAENNENIERKECAVSGKVSYFEKSVCAKSGKVSMNEVKYCTNSEAFVNASPSEVLSAGAKKASCTKSGKTCTKSKAACSKAAAGKATTSIDNVVLSAEAQAELAAENDENIERRECAKSGKVAYFQKSVCAKSGKVSMNEVKYCTGSEAFVNASPSKVMSAEADAKVVKTAAKTTGKKKACCAGKKKACGSKKAGA